MARKRNSTLIAIQMQTAMTERPQTYDDLCVVSGLSDPAVRHWIKQLRALNPVPIYVHSYGEDSRGRPTIPRFAWGTKPDAKRPGRSRAKATARQAAYRERQRGGA